MDQGYAGLTVDAIRERMDERFREDRAYPINILWDQVRAEELTAAVGAMIGDQVAGRDILEVGCGEGGSVPFLKDFASFVGTELSAEAVKRATKNYGCDNVTYYQMDAARLNFPTRSFDIVIAKEAIEHFVDQAGAAREAYRVLKPGGLMVVTSPNRNSLHLRMNRLLGHEDFKCSFDHVNELTYSEAVGLFTSVGFKLLRSAGVFLMPYWGLPEVGSEIRELTDNDRTAITMFRELGRLAGPEYAFCYVMLLGVL